MDVRTLQAGEEFRVQVNELSGLAGRGQTVPEGRELLAVGDESTDLFTMTRGPDGSAPSTVPWATAYAAPPDSGSNFEGVAADGHGHIVVLTEFPAGLVLLDMASLTQGIHGVHALAVRRGLDARARRHRGEQVPTT